MITVSFINFELSSFLDLKIFGTLHRESNDFFRIKKFKYFEGEGYRFMKGLRISVFKNINYL